MEIVSTVVQVLKMYNHLKNGLILKQEYGSGSGNTVHLYGYERRGKTENSGGNKYGIKAVAVAKGSIQER